MSNKKSECTIKKVTCECGHVFFQNKGESKACPKCAGKFKILRIEDSR